MCESAGATLTRRHLLQSVVIAFPDEGALKRFGGKLDAFGEPIVCTKRRDGGKRRVVINGDSRPAPLRLSRRCCHDFSSPPADGDPRGKHVVIVDDLVQTVRGPVVSPRACLATRFPLLFSVCGRGARFSSAPGCSTRLARTQSRPT